MSRATDPLTIGPNPYQRAVRAEQRAGRLASLVRSLEDDWRTLATLPDCPEAIRDFAGVALGKVREAERTKLL